MFFVEKPLSSAAEGFASRPPPLGQAFEVLPLPKIFSKLRHWPKYFGNDAGGVFSTLLGKRHQNLTFLKCIFFDRVTLKQIVGQKRLRGPGLCSPEKF